MKFPKFSTTFQTLERYRYSTTVGLLLLFLASFVLPVAWTGASGTWQFAAGLMFFLSFGMILSRDVWPWIRRKLGLALSERERSLAAMRVVEAAKQLSEEGEDPPFRIKLESEAGKDFITYNFEAASCRIEGEEIVVSEVGLKRLKDHI